MRGSTVQVHTTRSPVISTNSSPSQSTKLPATPCMAPGKVEALSLMRPVFQPLSTRRTVGSGGRAARVDLLGEVLRHAHPLERVDLALEPVGVGLLVADHLLEDGGGAVVAELVALLRGGVELGDGRLLAV